MVDKEGPIHINVVKRRIVESFDLRMGDRISKKLDSAILIARMKNYVNIDGDFLEPQNTNGVTLRIYKGGASKRSIEEISSKELMLAVHECVQNAISISEDDLVKETSRLFGLRATKNVSAKIEAVIKSMLLKKCLKQKSGKIIID